MSQWQGIFLKASIVSTCNAGLVVTEVTPGVGKSSTWKPDDLFLTDGQMFSILFDFHGLMCSKVPLVLVWLISWKLCYSSISLGSTWCLTAARKGEFYHQARCWSRWGQHLHTWHFYAFLKFTREFSFVKVSLWHGTIHSHLWNTAWTRKPGSPTSQCPRRIYHSFCLPRPRIGPRLRKNHKPTGLSLIFFPDFFRSDKIFEEIQVI